jgi:hypothetical protein
MPASPSPHHGRPTLPPAPKVSADGEVRLYEAAARAGITLLSIAHRPTLKRFHQLVIHFDGSASAAGRGWSVEDLRQGACGDSGGVGGGGQRAAGAPKAAHLAAAS